MHTLGAPARKLALSAAAFAFACAASSAAAQVDEVPPAPGADGADGSALRFDPRELADPGIARSGPLPELTEGTLVLPFASERLVLHYRRATDEVYRPLCVAPCRGALPEDHYQLAVAPPGHHPRAVNGNFYRVGPGDALQVAHENRSGLRSVGWVFLTGGSLALASTLATFNVFAVLLIGLPISLVFIAVGLPLVALMDHASVEVRPIPEALIQP